jgi:hypothetical protein
MSKKRISFMIAVMVFGMLFDGCGQPDATPTTELQPSVEQQARIQRVEQGLIPMTPGGDLDFEDPRPLAERMEHDSVPGLSIAVIEDQRLVWAKVCWPNILIRSEK